MTEAIVCDGCREIITGDPESYRVIEINLYKNSDGGEIDDITLHVHTGANAVLCRDAVIDKVNQFVAKHAPATGGKKKS